MSELDHNPIPNTVATVAFSSATSLDQPKTDVSVSSKTTSTRVTRASAAQQRTKLIKIAPAPPNKTKNLNSWVQTPLTREKTRRKTYSSEQHGAHF